SIGVVFYQMLTGTLPFQQYAPSYGVGRSDVSHRKMLSELVNAIITTPAPRVDERRQALPAMLVGIISKLLAKSPDDRYQVLPLAFRPSLTPLLVVLRPPSRLGALPNRIGATEGPPGGLCSG